MNVKLNHIFGEKKVITIEKKDEDDIVAVQLEERFKIVSKSKQTVYLTINYQDSTFSVTPTTNKEFTFSRQTVGSIADDIAELIYQATKFAKDRLAKDIKCLEDDRNLPF